MSDAEKIAEAVDAPPSSLDGLVMRLREFRAHAGSPSFSEITREVNSIRVERTARQHSRTTGRMTVYDCFRLGRHRMDVPLLLDIVRALGGREADVERWRRWCSILAQAEPPSILIARRGLPDPTPLFIGREAALHSILTARGPVAIYGMPGSGKTQLAVRGLRALHEQGHIGEFVTVDLRADSRAGIARTLDTAEAIMRALDEDVDGRLDEPEFLAAAASTVNRRRVGLLFDDVTDLRVIEPFIQMLAVPSVAVCRSLIEPRGSLSVVEAAPWSNEESEAHLREQIGPDVYDAEPEAARQLAVAMGGLPLASELLAARIRHRPEWSLDGHLDEWHGRQGTLPDAMEASIRLSYASLSPSTARAIRLISAAPRAGLDIGDVAAMIGADETVARRHVRALASARLVDTDGPLTLHPIIGAFAAARSNEQDAPAERRDAVDRLVDRLIDQAWASMAACYPSAFGRAEYSGPVVADLTPDAGGVFWRTRLAAALDLASAVAARRPNVAVEVSEVVAHHLDIEGRHALAERVHRMGLRSAEDMGDLQAIAACAHRVSQSLVRLGSPFAKSELLRAQQLARQAGSNLFVLKVSNTLAVLAAQEGDFDEAVTRFSEALDAAEQGELVDMLPGLQDNLGIVLRRAGDLEGARERHRHANRLAAQRGDHVMAALALGNLSDVEVAMGNYTSAARSAREAVAVTAEQAGLPHAYALTNLALAQAGLGHV